MSERTKKAGDRYMELVAEFPLRPIRSLRTLKKAEKMLNKMLDLGDLNTPGGLSQDEHDYLDVLGLLIARYEMKMGLTMDALEKARQASPRLKKAARRYKAKKLDA